MRISSNEVFHLEKLPKRIVIAGGGYIANEFAGIFHQFGSQVTLVNRTDVILRGYDEQIRDRLLQISMTKGIDFKFNATFEEIEKRDDGSLHVRHDRLRRHRGRRGAVRGRPQPEYRGPRLRGGRRRGRREGRRSRSTRTIAPTCRRSSPSATSPTASS